MSYHIIYGEEVIREDFPRLAEPIRKRIVKEVGKKLSATPDQFGRLLRGLLKGYRRLRVGDYRVIYRVDSKNASALIVMVMHRRTKYKGVKKRISKSD